LRERRPVIESVDAEREGAAIWDRIRSNSFGPVHGMPRCRRCNRELLGLPLSVAVAAALINQLVTIFIPAIPGWFAMRDLLQADYLSPRPRRVRPRIQPRYLAMVVSA
jgi:hypothetical protein